MLLRRALRGLNILIGVVLVALAGVFYWYALRPLPKTSGSIAAPVEREVSIERDRLGVPHIRAATLTDAVFAQGFVTAQDRLWQMDMLRRVASGTLSEVTGPATLELDRQARRMRIWRIAREQEDRLDAESRRILAAFARGVNFYLETHVGNLPPGIHRSVLHAPAVDHQRLSAGYLADESNADRIVPERSDQSPNAG